MTFDSREPESDAVARLRRGREIVAPSALWGRIEAVAQSDADAIGWPARLFAVAAGALIWTGASRFLLPCHDDVGVPAWVLPVDAAAPYLVHGTIEDGRSDALLSRPELLLVQAWIESREDSR